jgi:hypothetical protein
VEIARIFRAPADEFDPQLEAALVRARNARSSMPRVWLNMRIGGIVASPTPIVPISSLSTRVMAQSRASACDSIAAVIQPAEPPPTISTLRILRSFMMLPSWEPVSYNQLQPAQSGLWDSCGDASAAAGAKSW